MNGNSARDDGRGVGWSALSVALVINCFTILPYMHTLIPITCIRAFTYRDMGRIGPADDPVPNDDGDKHKYRNYTLDIFLLSSVNFCR